MGKNIGISHWEILKGVPTFYSWVRAIQKVDKNKRVVYCSVVAEVFYWLFKVTDDRDMKIYFKSQADSLNALKKVLEKKEEPHG